MKTTGAFEVTSKRRKGFPSEMAVKRGERIVRGVKELAEKLGRNDPCPCGSARSFQALLSAQWLLLTASIAITTSVDFNREVRV
jgi:SEC-C motif